MSGIRKVAGKGLKGMEALVNMKALRNGTNIIQLETHIATPIKFFEDSRAATDLSCHLSYYFPIFIFSKTIPVMQIKLLYRVINLLLTRILNDLPSFLGSR